MPGRTLLFDTASLYFRAFFGLPDSMTTPDGRPINAVRGLLDFLARFISDYRPDQVACCWDNSWRPQWRVDLVPTYKAHRVAYGDVEEVPAALTSQVPLIVEVLSSLGIPIIGADGYEADDVLATLTSRASGPVDVVTGDRDLFQLVDDDAGVRVLYVARGVRLHERVDDAWLATKYGVTGGSYVDFAVLRGDASDGLPGVKGIGEKTAASLLARHGDLEGIVAAASTLTPAVTRALASAMGYLGPAGQVVAAARDVPLPDLDLTLPATPQNPDAFARLTAQLGLGSSAERITAAMMVAHEAS